MTDRAEGQTFSRAAVLWGGVYVILVAMQLAKHCGMREDLKHELMAHTESGGRSAAPREDRRSEHDVIAHSGRQSPRPLEVGEPRSQTSVPNRVERAGWGLRSDSSTAALTGVLF